MSTRICQDLEILFHDRHVIAVNKPAGIPVGSEDSRDTTLLEMVRAWNRERQIEQKKGYCVPIHFLDRPVSGVIIFALSSKAATRLNEAFRGHKLSKVYWAVTEKVPEHPSGNLEHWLCKDHKTNVTTVVSKNTTDGKYCKLSYSVLETKRGLALLEVRPVTGRSHQIRVQLSAIGCPIYGDVKYGAARGWDHRVALHASRLEMAHPVGGEDVCWKAPVPEYWKSQWNEFETLTKD